jgi:hypothetical protein
MRSLESPSRPGEWPRPLSILAIGGSLRGDSRDEALLRATSKVVPEGVTVDLFEGLEAVPVFNEDLEGADVDPPGVVHLRRASGRATGCSFATRSTPVGTGCGQEHGRLAVAGRSGPGVVTAFSEWIRLVSPSVVTGEQREQLKS